MKLTSTFLIVLLASPAAFGITAAEQSIRDISAVVSQGQTLPEQYQSCDRRPEDYRVQVAAIFDENDLGVMTELGIPNQCFSASPGDEPPSGRFIILDDSGNEYPMGSGDTVVSGSVVATNAHVLLYAGQTGADGQPLPGDRAPVPPNRIIFRVYEGNANNCREVDYPVQSVEYGTLDPSAHSEDDFAVVKLGRSVTSYEPLQLAPEELVESTMAGGEDVLMVGFPNHPSNNNGANYSASVCRIQAAPPGNYYYGREVFVHDCDTSRRSSGSAATVVKPATGYSNVGIRNRYVRYFVGLNQGFQSYNANVDPNQSQTFDPNRNFNLGIALNPRLRQMIEEAARERVASIE